MIRLLLLLTSLCLALPSAFATDARTPQEVAAVCETSLPPMRDAMATMRQGGTLTSDQEALWRVWNTRCRDASWQRALAEGLPPARAAGNQRRAAAQAEAAQRREAIRATALPPDYREQIDADFVRTLKDPDSRKIAYQGDPYGSLVCGTVNARNSYGGYTGQQLFVAYFSQAGTLAAVLLFSPESVRAIHGLRATSTPRSPEVYLEDMLYSDCGGR